MSLNDHTTMQTCDKYEARIFIAGDISQMRIFIQQRFADEGNCISMEPTEFVYTGGYETGAVIRFINYARFPKKEKQILDEAFRLGNDLMLYLGQGSFTVESSTHSYFVTRRP